MLRFSVSNLHADSICWALAGVGAWPATPWSCRIIDRDEEQSGTALLETDAPRDAVKAAMEVIRSTDDRCTAIDFEITNEEWHAALEWYRGVARDARRTGRVQFANGIDGVCDAGAAGVADSQQYIVYRYREREIASGDPLGGYSPDEIVVGAGGQTLAQAADDEGVLR